MPTGALIMGGASLAGSLGSSLIGSSASKSASNAQIAAQQQSLAAIMRILQPIIAEGQGIVGQGQNILGSVLPTLTGAGQFGISGGENIINSAIPALTSLLTPGPNQTAALSTLPGFQFAQDWGQKAVQNIGSTTGLGGNTLAAGAQYATGLAEQGFGNYVNLLSGFLNQGMGLFGQGTGITQNVSNTGSNLINAGLTTQTNAASALGSGSQAAISGIGNAQATGILGSANAISGGLTSGLGGVSNAALLYGLSNRFGSNAAPSEYIEPSSGNLIQNGQVIPG